MSYTLQRFATNFRLWGCLLAREIKKLKSAVLVNDSVETTISSMSPSSTDYHRLSTFDVLKCEKVVEPLLKC